MSLISPFAMNVVRLVRPLKLSLIFVIPLPNSTVSRLVLPRNGLNERSTTPSPNFTVRSFLQYENGPFRLLLSSSRFSPSIVTDSRFPQPEKASGPTCVNEVRLMDVMDWTPLNAYLSIVFTFGR